MAITHKPTPARHQPETSTQEVLAGLVERVTFHNSDNGFCVLRAKARGHRDLVTVVGHAAIISAGEWIMASGEWVNDHTHGDRLLLADQHDKPLSSGQPGVEQVSLQHGVMLRQDRDNDGGQPGLPGSMFPVDASPEWACGL